MVSSVGTAPADQSRWQTQEAREKEREMFSLWSITHLQEQTLQFPGVDLFSVNIVKITTNASLWEAGVENSEELITI